MFFCLSYSWASMFRRILTQSPCHRMKDKAQALIQVWDGFRLSPCHQCVQSFPKIVSVPHGLWLVQPPPFVAEPVLLTRYPVFSLLKPKGLSCTKPMLLVNCWWNAQMSMNGFSFASPTSTISIYLIILINPLLIQHHVLSSCHQPTVFLAGFLSPRTWCESSCCTVFCRADLRSGSPRMGEDHPWTDMDRPCFDHGMAHI